MNGTVYSMDDIDQFDELARVLESDPQASIIQTSSGRQLQLPNEVVEILIRASEMMARGKAVVVSPQARSRFV